MGVETALIIAGIAGSAYAAHTQANAQHDSTHEQLNAQQKASDAEERARQDALDEARRRDRDTSNEDYDHYMRRYEGAQSLANAFGFNLPPAAAQHYTAPPADTPPSQKQQFQYTDNRKHGAAGPPPPVYGMQTDPNGGATVPPTTTAQMPDGIDPRFAAVYQKYGVTPGGLGSGPTDWHYYQNDAVAHANGDTNYAISRLDADLAKLRNGSSGASQQSSSSRDRTLASLFQVPDPTFQTVAPLAPPTTGATLQRRLTLGNAAFR